MEGVGLICYLHGYNMLPDTLHHQSGETANRSDGNGPRDLVLTKITSGLRIIGRYIAVVQDLWYKSFVRERFVFLYIIGICFNLVLTCFLLISKLVR